MMNDEAIKTLREDYCGNRIICELYPDQCNREDCEIWLAIKALETQPDGDVISRQAAINAIENTDCELPPYAWDELTDAIMSVPSAQPEQDREFIKLTVRNSNGRPYYSIIYLEIDDNGVGHDFEGYSSYSLDVISDYLKKYFMPSAQPDNQVHLCDSCKHTYPDCPSTKTDVIFGNGKGNDNICACNKYEPSAQPDLCDGCDRYGVSCVGEGCGKLEMPEIIRCRDCKHFEYDHPYIIQGVPVLGHEVCNAWGNGCKTDENGYCFLAERRADGTEQP